MSKALLISSICLALDVYFSEIFQYLQRLYLSNLASALVITCHGLPILLILLLRPAVSSSFQCFRLHV